MVFAFLRSRGQRILVVPLRINFLSLIDGEESLIFLHTIEIVDLREILFLEHDGIDVEIGLLAKS